MSPVLLLAGLALAADPPPTPQPTVFLYSLAYLGNKGLQAELKMTEAQAGKFAMPVFQYVLDVGNARRSEKSRDDLVKQRTATIEAVLDADQRKRLRQVV